MLTNKNIYLHGQSFSNHTVAMILIPSLAWRNLWRNRRRSLITISSVFFAVILAIFFYSIEKGTYQGMIDNMVRFSTGYIQVQDVLFEEEPSMDHSMLFDDHILDILERHSDEVSFYVPRIQHFALAAAGRITRGVSVMGIVPQKENLLNDISERLIYGEFVEAGKDDIVVAKGLSDILNVSTGDSIVLLGQGFQGATAAGIYRIGGIVSLNIPEMNNSTIYMPLEAAQWFYAAEERLTSLVIMPEDPAKTHQLAEKIRAEIDGEWYRVLTWDHMLQDLIAMMNYDMAGTFLMMGILYMIIAFGLFGTTLTMLLERKKEFAMLMALGMKRRLLALVCFTESVMISLTGAAAGIAAAIPVIIYFYHKPIQLSGGLAETMLDYGFEPVLPVSAHPQVFISQAIVVLILALLTGMFPVYSVFKLDVVKEKQK